MIARLVQYLSAFIVVAVIVAAIYVLPEEITATVIVAVLILFHLAIISALWGFEVGITGALIAFVAFNYFFTQPYYEFSVQRSSDVVIFVVFILVSMLISQWMQSTRFVPPNDQEARLLRILVGNLKHISRPESTLVLAKREWKVLSQIVENAVLRGKQIGVSHALEIDIPEGLPAVFVNSIQMEHIFTSLISHIRKYSPTGKAIYIRVWMNDALIYVQVSNKKPKLPSKEVEDILDKTNFFVSMDRITDGEPELSICREIVNAHGGQIWTEQVPDVLAFHFTLPLLHKYE